jgi:hypothetical protein
LYDAGVVEPGDWIPVPDRKFGTVWQLVKPSRCRNGHPAVYPNVTLSWVGCQCSDYHGHHVSICLVCDDRILFPPCTDETQRAR